MDKKEYLIRILDQLQPVWNLASGLKTLVEIWHLEDDMLNTITQAVEWAIHTTKSELAKRKLQKWLEALQHMKQMEAQARLKDEEDLKKLDKLLEEI